MENDDGACVTRMILFTPAWSRAYAPGTPADDMTVVVCERQDGIELDPMLVPTLELLSELITEMAPPIVTIKSAANEDVQALMGLIEWATASAVIH